MRGKLLRRTILAVGWGMEWVESTGETRGTREGEQGLDQENGNKDMDPLG